MQSKHHWNLDWVNGLSFAALATFSYACDKQPPSFVTIGHEETADLTAGSGGGESPDGTPAGDGTDGNEAGNGTEAGSGTGGEAGTSKEKTFKVQAQEMGKALLKLAGNSVSQTVTLRDEEIPVTVSYHQVDRPQQTELFVQGSDKRELSETFNQNADIQGVLDIALVIDNSGSMAEEQANLSTKLAPLLSYVAQSDWRIGVVTTDPSNGCLRSLISKGDANYATAFADAISAGTTGSGNERGILQAVNVLDGSACNLTKWVRPNSTVAVLIVSDEDNCSDGQGCSGQAYASSTYLTNYLSSIRTLGTDARVYGLIRHPNQAASACSTAANVGTIYSQAITLSSGTWGSICASDYTSTLSAISQNISVILKNQFALRYAPTQGSLEIFVDNVKLNGGYSVSGNVVTFATAPAVNSSIKFSYQYFSEPLKSTFALHASADPATVRGYLDGALIDSGTYTFDTVSQSLNFATPPEGGTIKVTYRPTQGLNKNFAIADTFFDQTLKVSVSGAVTTAYKLSADKKSITFNSAPNDNALIEVSYSKVGPPLLAYDLAVPADTEAQVFDDTGAAASFAGVEHSRLLVDAAAFRSGKKLVVVYQDDAVTNWKVEVAQDFIPETVRAAGSKFACDSQRIHVTGAVIDLADCGFKAGEQVLVTYDFAIGTTLSFTIDDAILDQAAERLRWTVKVDGVETTDFHLSGKVLSFDHLIPGATVTVIIELKNKD